MIHPTAHLNLNELRKLPHGQAGKYIRGQVDPLWGINLGDTDTSAIREASSDLFRAAKMLVMAKDEKAENGKIDPKMT